MRSAQRDQGFNTQARVAKLMAGLATILGVAALAAIAHASPAPVARTSALGVAPARALSAQPNLAQAATALFDNTGAAALVYYAGQGGHESLDDLHLTAGGSPDTVTFEYYEPSAVSTFLATVRIYGNPSGLDLAATPLLGTYTVAGLTTGRHIVSVPLPDAPVVGADIWIGVEFSSTTAGLLLNGSPSVGVSHDLYMEDGNFYDFGGSPPANFALRVVDNPSFGLSITTVGSGTVAKSPDQANYINGTPVQLTATPAAHWHFVGWSGDVTSATNPLNLVVSGNQSITATFAIDTRTITASAAANGTIAPLGATAVSYGGSQTFAITPNPNYHVLDVLVDGVSVGAPTSYPFINVTANHTIAVSFAIDTHTITASAGANGSISPLGTTTVNHGAAQGYAITPAANYHVLDVLVDGVSAGAVTSYTFSNVTVNHAIAASFVINTWTLSASAGANGSISPSGPVVVNGGGSQTFTIVPAACYSVASVSVDAVPVGAVTSYAFTNVTADHAIIATFAITPYAITASAGASGAISPNAITNVNCGGTQAYTITPALHYHVASVLVDGVSAGTVTSYTFTNVQATHTIAATFALDQLTIAASTGSNGSISPTGSVLVNYGWDRAFTIVPANNYTVATLTVDGVAVAPATSYTFIKVIANHTISATFAINGYTITSSAGANGTISPLGATLVTAGGTKAYTLTPAANYHVATLTVDAVAVAAATSYTFTNVVANHAIAVTFAINTYTLSYAAGANGTLTGTASQTVNYGANGTQVTAVANANYHFVSWSDGVLTAARADLNVNANLSVIATFASNYRLLASASFETGYAGWNPFEDAVLARVSPGHGSSTYGLKLTGPNSLEEFGMAGTPRVMSASDSAAWRAMANGQSVRYRVSAWVRSDAGHGRARIQASGISGGRAVLLFSSPTVVLSTAWQQVQVEILSSQVFASFQIKLLDLPAVVKETFVVDDITVELLPPPTSNLCTNGTFEVDTHGWAPSGTSVLSRLAGGHGGSYSLQLKGSASSAPFGCDDNPNWVTTVTGAGGIYRLTAWVKSAANYGYARLVVGEFLSGVRQGTNLNSTALALSSTWQKLTVDYVVKKAGSTLTLAITDTPASGYTAETFLVDDVSIMLAAPSSPATVLASQPSMEEQPVAIEYALPMVYPNPMRREATLALSMVKAGPLRIELFDPAGRVVRVVTDESQAAAGTHRFLLGAQAMLPSGIYFYRAKFGGIVQRGRFVVLE